MGTLGWKNTWALGTVLLAACTGTIGKAGGPTGPLGPTEGPSCTSLNVGPAPLHRLTRTQYNNTVRDLLGDDSRPATTFVPDEDALGFAVGMSVSPLLAEQYMGAAETLSAAASLDLPALLQCDPVAEGEDTCATRFVASFGRRAFRRALDAGELGHYQGLYSSVKGSFGFQTAIEAVVQAMLQAPQFLYRVELGVLSDGPVVPLSQTDVASRLSYFIWESMPDEELLAAAEAGELGSPDDIEAQARRLLADDRARQGFVDFHDQWLALNRLDSASKDPGLFPEWDDALRDAMREETNLFIERVLFDGDARLSTLLTSSTSYINGPLATLYGVDGVTGSEHVLHSLDPTQRSGILTQVSVMSIWAKRNQTSPTHRGKFVRERLLCQLMPPPPPGLMVVPPEPTPGETTRQRFARHASDPSCSSCHQLMDPIGFGFEAYDAIGRFRTEDEGQAVDASGEIFNTTDVNVTFDGAVELGQRLNGSVQVRECVATQWFRYAFSRAETESDDCSQGMIYEAFEGSGYDIRELVVAIARSDAFRYRRAQGGS